MDYIDLYLVHAPPENPDHRAPVWQAMEYCLEQGWVKSIGVSNYGPAHSRCNEILCKIYA